MISTERIMGIRAELKKVVAALDDEVTAPSREEVDELCRLALVGVGLEESVAGAQERVAALVKEKPDESIQVRALRRELARAERRNERGQETRRRLEKQVAALETELAVAASKLEELAQEEEDAPDVSA